MNENLITIILGIIAGSFLGLTGFTPTALILFFLEYFKIGDYKTNLGTMLFFNLFPISIGSVYNFYEDKKINFTIGIILTITIMISSYISSNLVVGKNSLSIKNLKYITAVLCLLMAFTFFYTGYYEKN